MSPTQADVDFVVRKAGHMFVFGVLAMLIWRALALTVGYAASVEFHQSFTAGRHASPVDVGINSVGALLFLLALMVWLQVGRGRNVAPRPDRV